MWRTMTTTTTRSCTTPVTRLMPSTTNLQRQTHTPMWLILETNRSTIIEMKNGKVHSYDSLQEDLIFSAADFSEQDLRKAEKMKRIEAGLDIAKIVRTSEEAEKGITIPAPQLGKARDLRVHVSTKAGPANLAIVAKRAGEPSSNCDSTAISEHDRLPPAVTSARPGPSDTNMEVPLTFSFTLEELDA